MKGLELARAYYEQFGRPMLERDFPEYLDRMAIGLAGHGSECYGYDDGISTDHDYEPGFCIWLGESDDREFGFRLFRAYGRLPREFMGVRMREASLFGSGTRGVHTIEEYYRYYLGSPEPPETLAGWLAVPDSALCEAVNGEVFSDPSGRFSGIRRAIKEDRPEDVRLKKLASEVIFMAQTGQYNYGRCLDHGETAAAAAALADFASHAARAAHLLCRTYAPYYKWLFRSLRGLPRLSFLADDADLMLRSPADRETASALIEKISSAVAADIRDQGLCDCTDAYLEPYAYGITERIGDASLRNSPVML